MIIDSLLLFLSSAVLVQAHAIENPWTKIRAPSDGIAESIGTPTAGCIRGAKGLKEGGKGYFLMRPSRGRSFGHPRLVGLLEKTSASLHDSKKAPLLIGDLGLPRGGPTLSAHASHQSGLDADIWYLRHQPWVQKNSIRAKDREKFQPVSMVDRQRFRIKKTFREEETEILRKFSESTEVDRILVHFVIKKHLCQKYPDAPWIRKIRAWFGHDYHFHLRLTCSSADRLCQSGEAIPPGNGCDETLEWWFSDEARAEEKRISIGGGILRCLAFRSSVNP